MGHNQWGVQEVDGRQEDDEVVPKVSEHVNGKPQDGRTHRAPADCHNDPDREDVESDPEGVERQECQQCALDLEAATDQLAKVMVGHGT